MQKSSFSAGRFCLVLPTLLSGTALALTAGAGHAATCVVDLGTITCSDPVNDPVASAESNLFVTINDNAAVVSDTEGDPALDFSGDDVTVNNAGAITQTDTSNGGYAIFTTGSNDVLIDNAGSIASGDRGIETEDGSNLTVINRFGATIDARRQAIRSGTDTPGARVENAGTITSTEGRAIQVRSFGATVINTGEIIGGEEVVEARGDFTLENYGVIRLIDPSIEDEDGVQFAGGTVTNQGSITGSDDGIDLDEGTIYNAAGGTIISTAPDANDNSGIDIDEVYDDGVNPERVNGLVEIVNEGLIEGPSAIGADDAAVNEVKITNSGTLRGRGGTALRMAPGQGTVTLEILAGSIIEGGARFGAGDDSVLVNELFSGALMTGGVFMGNEGINTFTYVSSVFDLMDISVFDVDGDDVDLAFEGLAGTISGSFSGFTNWSFGGTKYTTTELAAALVSPVAPVPLPAGMALMLTGLGGLAIARRRRSKG